MGVGAADRVGVGLAVGFGGGFVAGATVGVGVSISTVAGAGAAVAAGVSVGGTDFTAAVGCGVLVGAGAGRDVAVELTGVDDSAVSIGSGAGLAQAAAKAINIAATVRDRPDFKKADVNLATGNRSLEDQPGVAHRYRAVLIDIQEQVFVDQAERHLQRPHDIDFGDLVVAVEIAPECFRLHAYKAVGGL